VQAEDEVDDDDWRSRSKRRRRRRRREKKLKPPPPPPFSSNKKNSFLADSEARLQVLIDASTLSLEEATAAVLERVPAAAADAACLEADAAILHGAAASALDRVATAAEAAEAATAPLAALERVHSAAEATARTLDEGASLAGLLAGADDLLAAGDAAALGRALEGMRSGLAAVGDLPEFAGGAARLARLQARLTALVEPQLAAALAARAGGRAAELAALLDVALGVRKHEDAVGGKGAATVSSSPSSAPASSYAANAAASSLSSHPFGAAAASDPLPRLFAAARSPELAAAWDAFDAGAPAGFVGWLPGFYAAAEDALTADARWAAAALPSRAPELVAALVTSAARGADRSFRARLAASLAPREFFFPVFCFFFFLQVSALSLPLFFSSSLPLSLPLLLSASFLLFLSLFLSLFFSSSLPLSLFLSLALFVSFTHTYKHTQRNITLSHTKKKNPVGGARALQQLSAVARAARSHAASVSRILEGAPRAAAEAALAAIVAPVEAEFARYGELEAAALASDLAAAVGDTWTVATAAALQQQQQQQQRYQQGQAASLLRPADASDALSALGKSVLESTALATARCLDLTGGSGLPALLSAADAAFSRAAATAAAALRASPPSVADGEMGAATELLSVAAAAESAATAAAVDASVALRACILRAVPPLLKGASAAASGSAAAPWKSNGPPVPGSDFDAFVNAARVRESPELRAALERLVSAAASSTSDAGLPAATSGTAFSPLPASGSAFAELVAAARGAVRRALLAEVTAPLASVASLPCWGSRSGGNNGSGKGDSGACSSSSADGGGGSGGGGGGLSLPSFSAYPQAWATAAGEALLALPAALESALEAQRKDEPASSSSSSAQQEQQQQQQVVDDGGAWLDEVTADAASAALAQVGSIGSLSAPGAAQLAADLGYFCGALRTLGASVPAPLATWAVASSWPEAAFAGGGAADGAVARGEVDGETVRLVAAVRGIAAAP